MTALDSVLAAATAIGATVVRAPGATVIVVPDVEARQAPDEHLPEREAARIAGVSVRILRDARRAGELAVFGRQRSRTVRRDDLERWIASRRVERMPVPDELVARVEHRLATKRRAGARRSK